MKLWPFGKSSPEAENGQLERSSGNYALSFQDYANYFSFNGSSYPLMKMTQGFSQEEISADFIGLCTQAYRSNGVVFACILARLMLFTEARFQWRKIVNGRPGELSGTSELLILEQPWPSGTTGDLLGRMLLDADLDGSAFIVRESLSSNVLQRLRPDWVSIVLGSNSDDALGALAYDAEVLGYVYHPGGRNSGKPIKTFLPNQVAHFAPIPDPMVRCRGMSWLTPIIREVMGDQAATTHKIKFFENGATPNLAVTLDMEKLGLTPELFRQWVQEFDQTYSGLDNAYKTMYLVAATPQVIGANMEQIDFKVTQGAGETRIAAAAGVPPVIVGLSEGLQASTYSNYSQARRRFADGTMRPLWRNVAGSLQTLVPAPAQNFQLWVDTRDIAFLREDAKESAQILQIQAQAIRTLIDGGFEPETVVSAISTGDMTRLQHTGNLSVQLQPPGTNFKQNGQPAVTPQEAKALVADLAAELRQQEDL